MVDATPPGTPVISGAWDDVAGGAFNALVGHNGLTNDTRPELRGSAEANSVVTIYGANGQALASVLANGSGNWAWTPPAALSQGPNNFYVKATDAAGNNSAQSATFTLNVDTNAPTVSISKVIDDFGSSTGDIASGGTTDDKTPTVVGKAETGATVTLEYNDGSGWKTATVVVADSNGDWRWTPAADMAYGNYQFRASGVDAAGNTSSYSNFDLNIKSGVSVEEFDQFFNGNVTLASGLSLQILKGPEYLPIPPNAVPPYNSAGANRQSFNDEYNVALSAGTIVKFTIPGGAEELSYLLHATANPYTGYAVPATAKYYSTTGVYLGQQINSGDTSNQLRSFTAPAGQKIGYFTIESGINYAPPVADGKWLVHNIDYVQWGEKGSGAAAGRPTSRMMDVEDDESATLSIDENGHEINVNESEDQSFNAQSNYMVEAENNNAGVNAFASDANNQSLPKAEPVMHLETNTHTLVLEHAEQPLDFHNLVATEAQVTVVDMANGEANVLTISLGDILAHGEEHAFTADDTRQLMIKGDAGDVVNLTDLLPDGTDPGNWAKAEGTVTVGGVQYEVYQHSGADTELLVQLGVQTNLNNH